MYTLMNFLKTSSVTESHRTATSTHAVVKNLNIKVESSQFTFIIIAKSENIIS